jgi:hypothetical protein
LPPFPWSKLLPLVLTVVLYWLFSYLLYRWLYRHGEDEAKSSSGPQTEAEG